METVICPVCLKSFGAFKGEINRAIKNGYQVRCSQVCSGIARRSNKTPEQKKLEKQAYDKEYRAKNLEVIKAKKSAHFKKTYDPVKAAIERKKRMPKHVEYCRRPEYKAWKVEYDKKYRAKQDYGEFADCFLLTQQIFSLIDNREIKYINGLTNKSQIRKRKWQTSQNQQNLPPIPSKALYGKH